MNEKAKRPCPECNSFDVLPILYGLPSAGAIKEYEQGRISLGGCVVGTDDPEWSCQACGHAWRSDR
jgi:hypothetical protein